LAPNGRFSVVLPLLEGMRFEELAATYHLFVTRRCEVRPRPSKPVHRLLLEMTRQQPGSVETASLSIHAGETGEARSAAYIDLTRDFYLAY
jgi:tRNA1Val (adenine37-N6)-methyltransferase